MICPRHCKQGPLQYFNYTKSILSLSLEQILKGENIFDFIIMVLHGLISNIRLLYFRGNVNVLIFYTENTYLILLQ